MCATPGREAVPQKNGGGCPLLHYPPITSLPSSPPLFSSLPAYPMDGVTCDVGYVGGLFGTELGTDAVKREAQRKQRVRNVALACACAQGKGERGDGKHKQNRTSRRTDRQHARTIIKQNSNWLMGMHFGA